LPTSDQDRNFKKGFPNSPNRVLPGTIYSGGVGGGGGGVRYAKSNQDSHSDYSANHTDTLRLRPRIDTYTNARLEESEERLKSPGGTLYSIPPVKTERSTSLSMRGGSLRRNHDIYPAVPPIITPRSSSMKTYELSRHDDRLSPHSPTSPRIHSPNDGYYPSSPNRVDEMRGEDGYGGKSSSPGPSSPIQSYKLHQDILGKMKRPFSHSRARSCPVSSLKTKMKNKKNKKRNFIDKINVILIHFHNTFFLLFFFFLKKNNYNNFFF